MRKTSYRYAASVGIAVSILGLVAPLTRAQDAFVRTLGGAPDVRPRDRDPAAHHGDPAQAAQGGGTSLCVEDTFQLSIVSHHPELKGVTIVFAVFAEPPGVVGFGFSPEGPFSVDLFVAVKLNSRGNGRSDPFFVQGAMPGQTLVQAVSTAGDVLNPQHVTVADVFGVTFEDLDSPLDVNPNVGLGLRIFPDKQSPADPVDRSRVRVLASAGPPGSVVWFRSFDIDDPSSNACPLDCKGSKGDDNHGSPGDGELSAHLATIDGQGIAEVEFGVTLQPGDNFKVAASCNPAHLGGVVVDGVDLKDAEGNVLPTPRVKVTDMLTVWRKVHVEMDSMGHVVGNQVLGTVKQARPGKKGKGPETTVLTVDRVLPAKRFELGFMRIDGVGLHLVVTNTRKTVTVAGSVTEAEVQGKSFTLVDDDDFNGDFTPDGDDGANIPAPDLGLIADGLDGVCDDSAPNVFADAYVCPVFDVGDNNDVVPFVVNTARASAPALIATYDFDTVGTEADERFWTVYLLGAYQYQEKQDADPNREEATVGAADDNNGQGASVFVEPIAEVEAVTPGCAFNREVVVHEIGHLFNGLHQDGGVMSDSTGPCEIQIFSDETLLGIRTIAHP